MSVSISIGETQIYTALKAFLGQIVNSGYEIVQGQQNNVATPQGPYIVMQILYTPAMSTDVVAYTPPLSGQPGTGTAGHSRSNECVIQLDVYGDTAGDDANTITLLTRTMWAADYFSNNGDILAPLFATDARNTSMINGEQQYENRYTQEFHAQYNPVSIVPQDFADSLTVEFFPVDAIP